MDRNSKDYWFFYSDKIDLMAYLYHYVPYMKENIQISDYCPNARCFYLVENDWTPEGEDMTFIETCLLDKYKDTVQVRRAKNEDLDDFLSDYWDGNVDWEKDTYEIKRD